MNLFLMITYVVSAVAGSTLIKLGSKETFKALFTLPIVNMHITLVSLVGILAYGISFVSYVILLTRFELSFVSPLLVAFVYILLMVTAFLIFKEGVTLGKLTGSTLILIGVILILIKK